MLTLLWIACGGAPPPAGFAETSLDDADAVAAADLDGDGADALLLILGDTLRWPGGEATLGGAVQAVARGDTDGDGREEAWIGVGMSRDFREASARVWRVDHTGAQVVWEQSGPRNQITELRIVEGRVWLGVFTDERSVAGGWLDPAQGLLVPLATGALMTRQLPVGEDLVVGRIYGDAPRSDGDLRLRSATQPERTLPSLRGVRALAAADLDSDGDLELVVGDGWHYDYGERALARVALLEGPGWERARTLALLEGDYSVRQIEPIGPDLLVTGARGVSLLRRDTLGWVEHRLAPVTEQGNAVGVRTPAGPGVLVAGRPARLIPLPAP